MTPAPGLAITPHITLTRKLGEGGMGAVWGADHATLQTEVAVKIISAEHAADETARARFMQEAATASQIKSPHVVQMLDRGFLDGGTPYIVMELLHGESVRERIDRAGPMSTEEVSAMLTQVGRALDLAHAQGIVHRDLKPENLFLLASGEQLFVKILDFGIAKSQQPGVAVQTATFAVIGTPRYMSPEQLVDTKNATLATDVWALGAVAYEALTGAVPFDAESVPALTLAVFSGEFPPASQRRPALPPGLDAWFARVFQQEPSDRFTSTGEMAQAFEEALRAPAPAPAAVPASTETVAMPLVADPPVPRAVSAETAPSAAAVPAQPPRGRRNALWLGLAAAAIVSTAAVGGVALWLKGSAESSAGAAAGEAVAGDVFESATAIVNDAIQRNDAHGTVWAMTFHADGEAQIDLQDAKDPNAVQRYAYVGGKLESSAPLELSKADRRRLEDAVFRKSAARLDMLPQLLPQALKRAKALDGARVDHVVIHRTTDQRTSRPIQAVVIHAGDDRATYEFWGNGRFRCERKSGASCPEKP